MKTSDVAIHFQGKRKKLYFLHSGGGYVMSDGAPLKGTPLNGRRTMVIDRDGTIYLALREGNAL
jgi:hypothetical protein